MIEYKCSLITKSGGCGKFDARHKCKDCRSNRSWFDDKLNVCPVWNVCEKASIFGNRYYKITKEQLEALKAGMVLYDVDEYGTFIVLEQEEKT